MMREVCRQVCPFFAQQQRSHAHLSTRKSVPQSVSEGKRDTTLSSVASFDARLKKLQTALKNGENIEPIIGHKVPVSAQNKRVHQKKHILVNVHADMLKVKVSQQKIGVKDREKTGGGIRGEITGFSRASRKRMIETMASVRNTGAMLFLTMTFDDSVLLNTNDNLNAMFEAFRRRFERAFPTWCAIWRKEWQDRKSGDFIGTFVPHYHFIIMTGVHLEKQELEQVSESFALWGKTAWHEITSSADENHLVYGFDVSPVRSRKHAYYYVAKYVAKHDSKGDFPGRHWGRIGKLDCSVSETFSLDTEEYIIFRRLVKRWLKTRVQSLPQGANGEQIRRWKCRTAKQKRYARSFAKQPSNQGCTIFGLGDTNIDGSIKGYSAGYWQLITEAKRQAADRRERERGFCW